MKKILKAISMLCAALAFLSMSGIVRASLITIGTATYSGSDYNLIWDDDNNGKSVIWLDYTSLPKTWNQQINWASTLNGSGILSYHINSAYTVDWGVSDWRLPETVDGVDALGYQGPDNGMYDYTSGYNLYNSEMGHLYYEELGNKGYVATDGSSPQPGWGLINKGDFQNLDEYWYWSSTEYAASQGANAWGFYMHNGRQNQGTKDFARAGLALREGRVSTVPIPEPPIILLFFTAIVGLTAHRGKRKGNST